MAKDTIMELELTLERFLDKGFYYLVTASVFESKYKGSDNIWRNTCFQQQLCYQFSWLEKNLG